MNPQARQALVRKARSVVSVARFTALALSAALQAPTTHAKAKEYTHAI